MINAVPDSVSKGIGNFSMIIFAGYITASLCSAGALMLLVDFSLKPTRGVSKNQAINSNLPQVDSPNYFSIRKGVVNRNLFNSDGEVPDEKVSSRQVSEVPKGEFDLSGPCNKSTLPLKLTGTIYMGANSKASLATIVDTSANESDTYVKGDAIIDHESASVALIERKRVILNNNGSKECLEIDFEEGAKTASVGSSPISRPGPETSSNKSNESNEEVSASGETVVLTSSYVEEQLGEGFGKIIQAARLVPKNDQNGSPEGFKIFAIKPQSILSKMGFKNGDIITKVNDTSMKSPDQGFALYQSLQDENDIVIQVLRGGSTPKSLKVQIK